MIKNKKAEEGDVGNWWTIILICILIVSFLIAAAGIYILINKLTG